MANVPESIDRNFKVAAPVERVRPSRPKGHEKQPAKMLPTIGGVSLSHAITDENRTGVATPNPSV
jgi:hypothetical protein